MIRAYLLLLLLSGGLGLAFVPCRLEASARSETTTADAATKNYEEGMRHLKQGEIDGALDSFLQAIYFSRNNYNPKAWFALGECYKLKGQDAKAVEAFNKHIEQTVGRAPEAHLELGNIYMRNNRDAAALNEFNKALMDYYGPAPPAHYALGRLAEKQGDFSGASVHYRDALGDPPWTYAEAWLAMSECYMRMGNWNEAMAQLNTILNSNRLKNMDYQKVYLDLGACLLAKGDHEGAIRKWRECLSLNPSNAVAHLNLAMVFDQESHISSAINEYKAFVRLMPNDPKTFEVKTRLTILEQQIKPAEPEQTVKPSPFMRKEQEEKEMEKRREFEKLAPPRPAESGF